MTGAVAELKRKGYSFWLARLASKDGGTNNGAEVAHVWSESPERHYGKALELPTRDIVPLPVRQWSRESLQPGSPSQLQHAGVAR